MQPRHQFFSLQYSLGSDPNWFLVFSLHVFLPACTFDHRVDLPGVDPCIPLPARHLLAYFRVYFLVTHIVPGFVVANSLCGWP